MTRPASESPTTTIVRREARAVAAAIDLLFAALLALLTAIAALIVMLIQVDPFQHDPTPGQWAVGYAVFLLCIPAVACYAALGARTLGARLLHLDVRGGSRRRTLIRGLMWWPSLLLVGGAGLWWPWLDPQGRSLTDIVCGAPLVETIPS